MLERKNIIVVYLCYACSLWSQSGLIKILFEIHSGVKGGKSICLQKEILLTGRRICIYALNKLCHDKLLVFTCNILLRDTVL